MLIAIPHNNIRRRNRTLVRYFSGWNPAFFVIMRAECRAAGWILSLRQRGRSSAAVILFKACPRCGGDIDISRSDDIYCVQCSHRPEVVYPGPRIVQEASQEDGSPVTGLDPIAMPHGPVEEHTGGPAGPAGTSCANPCPRCGSVELVPLDKLRQRDNNCYRCCMCGHIFSPATGAEGARRRSTIS